MTFDRLVSVSIFLGLGFMSSAVLAEPEDIVQIHKKNATIDNNFGKANLDSSQTLDGTLTAVTIALSEEKKQEQVWSDAADPQAKRLRSLTVDSSLPELENSTEGDREESVFENERLKKWDETSIETLSPHQLSQGIPTIQPPRIPELRGDILRNRQPILTTAQQLQQGEVVTNLRYRQTFPSGDASDVGLTGQPTFGLSWGLTDNLEITFDVQTVDNSGPGGIGNFSAQRTTSEGSGNFFQELTLQAKQRIWENQSGTQALSGVVAISRGVRSYRFFDANNLPLSDGDNKQELVPSLELPYTIQTGNDLQFTLSPKVAFLPEDNALYFRIPPIDNPGSFGTNLGLAIGASYRANSRILLWGDAFVPFTGNNTIERETGRPQRTIAFNGGLRYIVNPRLATDIFISNTLGNTGALSVVADNELISLGLGLNFIPGFTSANRRYPQHFGDTQQPPPYTPAGFAFFDGGTLPNQQLLTTIRGGSQGVLTSLRYGLLDDFEAGIFLDSISGEEDESELGISGKIRFMHQADGDPFTLSGLITAARSNNVLTNLLSENRDEFKNRDLDKRGFAFSNEVCSENGGTSGNDGECIIITLSAPMHYQFQGGSAIWLTPTVGYVQRNGLEIAGFNLGGSIPVLRDLNLIAEAGLNLTGDGNTLSGDNRKNAIPWTLGVRWNPSSLFGISSPKGTPGLQLELYVTNRVGATPFHNLRVRADNDVAVGFGLLFPIQF